MPYHLATPQKITSVILSIIPAGAKRAILKLMIRSQIENSELLHAQMALVLAIILQVILDKSLVVGPKYLIGGLELLLVIAIGLSPPHKPSRTSHIRRIFSFVLIALISVANATSMALVAGDLINGTSIPGKTLIASAGAIFLTNIIIFSLWYWELDSPALTGLRQHDAAPKFDFPQMESVLSENKNWEPGYSDYLYLSTTNASAFSPTDTMPLTHGAKFLMALQALISLVAVVLVTARAVNILG